MKPELQFGHRLMMIPVCDHPGIINWKPELQSLKSPMEKEMVAPSSILAWKIPWTAEPTRAPGSAIHGVAKSWTRLSDFTH